MINPEALKVMQKLNKKYGKSFSMTASDVTEMPIMYKTGSTTFNYILGGGLRSNCWHEFIGDESQGKTFLALKTVAKCQELDPDFTTVWVAAEDFDIEWATQCGVDMDRVILIETVIMEEAYDALFDMAESHAVDMMVVDSYAALVPAQEDGKLSGEMSPGRGALLTNQFFRKIGKVMKRSLIEHERPIVGIMINQWREKIGVMHGDPRTTPGGKGKNFAYVTRTEIKRDEWIEIGSGTNKARVGQSIRMRTIKNKSAPVQKVAYFDMYFDNGGECSKGSIDFGKEIVALCMVEGHIERRGAWYYYGDQQWQGSDAVVQAVREDVDLREELEQLALNSAPVPEASENE